jgi:sarcosine oxidase gamma subunit
MARRTGESRLTGRGARRLAGAVSLLLAACLIAGSLTLAIHASNPPPMPHQFYGTVSFGGAPVDEDTLVEAFVGGVKEAQTTVDAAGRYGYDPAFTVPGTAGAEVTFRVGSVLANESGSWQSGKVEELNLTVDEEPEPPIPRYSLTMAAVPEAGGNATDETGTSPYLEGAQVAIKAQAQDGYRFVNWTSAPVGIIDDEDVPETFLTMPGVDVTVTANFDEIPINDLTVTSEAGGSVTVTIDAEQTLIEAGQAETISDVAEGTQVDLVAAPADGYRFIEWGATAGQFDDAKNAQATFIMPAEAAAVTAVFAEAYELTMAVDPAGGGTAIDVTGDSPYAEGTAVDIRAQAEEGYGFVSWTSDPEGIINDEEDAETFLTMPAQDVIVTANFAEGYALTMAVDPAGGGTAIDVTGDSPYAEGTVVDVRAEAEGGYGFVNWTSDPENIIDDEEDAETFLTMPGQDVIVTANFELRPEVPTVITGPATDITIRAAVLSMTYTTGNYSSVDVRFSVKRATDVTWFNDTWVSRTEDGTYSYGLTELQANTEYEFKAQLRYDSTVLEDEIRRFTTPSQTTMIFPPFCFIATAAYGTPSAEQIDVLREFRDVVLAQSSAGSRFVALYYRLSPPVADVIAASGFLRTLVRELLVDPVVWIVDATGDVWRS